VLTLRPAHRGHVRLHDLLHHLSAAPTASASSPSYMFSTIPPIATLTVSVSASRSSALVIDALVW
jgi:hypothetical protein